MKRIIIPVATLLYPMLSVAQSDYMPKFDGAVKARVEMTTGDSEYRFNLRNARFGVSGKAGTRVSYRMQVDLSNNGQMVLLDGYAAYASPTGDFNISIGQQLAPFSTDAGRGPASSLFANRSFVSKYLTSYHGGNLTQGEAQDYVKTVGLRDLGVLASYKLLPRNDSPSWAGAKFERHLVKLSAGIFNGTGINNPQWGSSVNVLGRVDVYPLRNVRVSGSYYSGRTPEHNEIIPAPGPGEVSALRNRVDMLGFEAEYSRGNFFIGGEYARRTLHNEAGGKELITMALVQSRYLMSIHGSDALSYWGPSLRWDLGNNIDYINLVGSMHDKFDASRVTAGISLGLAEKVIRSEVRINYEKHLFRGDPADRDTNKLLQDKVTLEFVASF